jgi:hypothetical protein
MRGVSDHRDLQSSRGAGEISYFVEETQQGEVLNEERLGGRSQPLRCPKAV